MNRIKNKKKWIIVLIVIDIFIVLTGVVGYKAYKYALSEVAVMKQYGNTLKGEAKELVKDIKQLNFEAAEEKTNKLRSISSEIRERLNKPIWKLAMHFPVARDKVKSVVTMLDVMEEGIDLIAMPFYHQVKENPFDNFKVGDGFNAAIIRSYIDFAEKIEPVGLRLFDKVSDIDLSFIDKDGKIAKYQQKAIELYEVFKNAKADLEVAKTIFGNGDRYYMFAAQNAAELRASGGFVGSVGTIRIKDGILYIGDFETVYNVMLQYTPESGKVTDQELRMFKNRLAIAHDSEYNPDFRRVAEIWTSAYEPYNGVKVDGVISMTPVLIQKMLNITGGEIKLSDGTVMNGNNATKVIEHDIYHKYYNIYSYSKYTDYYVDTLFEETAKKAMKEFTSNFSVKQIMDYYKLYKEVTRDRTLLIWMKDPNEEQIMIDAGVSGVLNTGKNNAVAGVYLNNARGSKMGMYTTLDCQSEVISQKKGKEAEYKITVTINNTISDYDLEYCSTYILGTHKGKIPTYLHLFAPVGGTISDIQSSDGLKYTMDEYLGLQMGYCLDIYLYPRSPVTITYKVTTGKDVTDPISFSVTPTLQDYFK